MSSSWNTLSSVDKFIEELSNIDIEIYNSISKYKFFLCATLPVFVSRWKVSMSKDEISSVEDIFFKDVRGEYILLGLNAVLKDLYHQNMNDKPTKLMNDIICRYVACKVMSQIEKCTWIVESLCDDIIQSLCNFPDSVMFCLEKNEKNESILEFFQPMHWFLKMSQSIANHGSKNFQAMWISKLSRIGQCDLIPIIWKSLDLMELVDTTCIYNIVVAFVKSDDALRTSIAERSRKIEHLLPIKTVETSPVLQNLVLKKLLLGNPFSCHALWSFVDYLSNSTSLTETLAIQIARAWSTNRFVNDVDVDRQEYVSGVLYAMLDFLNAESIQSSGFFLMIMDGIQLRLGSGVERIRHHGMFVGQKFSKLAYRDNVLKFEILNDKQFRFEKPTDTTPPDTSNDTTLGDSLPHVDTGADSNNPQRDDSEDEDDEDPDKPIDFFGAQVSEKLNVWTSESDSDDESSTSSLEPMKETFQTDPNDPGIRKLPRFLRDCLPMFASDDFETMSCLVNGLPDLIREAPHDLHSVASDLARLLLSMENKFNIENFSQKRLEALVEITAASPEEVVPLLSKQALHVTTFTSIRFVAIDVMIRAAELLSSIPLNEQSLEGSKPVLKQLGVVTKRWGVRKSPQPKRTINRFATIAPMFFYSLWENPKNSLDLLQREPLLLSRVIVALSLFVGLGRNGERCDQMCGSLLELVLVFHQHTEARVRSACLFGFIQVHTSLRVLDTVAKKDLATMMHWIDLVITNDPDPDCRSQAATFMKSVKSFVGQ